MSAEITRRKFLRNLAMTTGASILAGCTQTEIVKETVVQEKLVKETVVVEDVVKETVVVEKMVTPTPAPQGKQSIVMWTFAENHMAEYDQRIDEVSEQFGIDFSIELMSRDAMNKKYPTTLMAGTGFPDICEWNSEEIVKFLKGPPEEITFAPLDEALANSPYAGDVLESRWARFRKDGITYGAPHDVHPTLLLYDEPAWEDLGIDLTELVTWDDYLAVCEIVGTDSTTPDGKPRWPIMDAITRVFMRCMLLELGIWWNDADGEPMLTDPRFKQAVEQWLLFDPYRAEYDKPNRGAMSANGQWMSQLAPDWMYGIVKQGNQDNADYMEDPSLRAMRIPDFVADGPHSGTHGGSGCTVPKPTPNVDLAREVMFYLYFDNSMGQLEMRWNEIGIFPPVKSAWEGDAFHAEDPFVGGQKIAELYIEAAEDLPAYSDAWSTRLIQVAWDEQAALVWSGELGVDEAIQIADENARAEIERNA